MTTPEPRAPLAKLSVEALAARAQGGDQACFHEIARRVREPLRAFLARRLERPDDADDVVQETLLRAYRHLGSYDPERRFTTWLYAIGKNVAVNHQDAARRRREREREAADAAMMAGGGSAGTREARVARPAADGTLAGLEVGAIWQTARRVLGADAYQALWLRYAGDLAIKDVARELGKSVVATKVLLYRARKKLMMEET